MIVYGYHICVYEIHTFSIISKIYQSVSLGTHILYAYVRANVQFNFAASNVTVLCWFCMPDIYKRWWVASSMHLNHGEHNQLHVVGDQNIIGPWTTKKLYIITVEFWNLLQYFASFFWRVYCIHNIVFTINYKLPVLVIANERSNMWDAVSFVGPTVLRTGSFHFCVWTYSGHHNELITWGDFYICFPR